LPDHLSICPKWAHNSKTKKTKHIKIKIDTNVPKECQFSIAKVKVQGHRTSKTENWRHVYLQMADQVQAGQVLIANKAYAIVRPN